MISDAARPRATLQAERILIIGPSNIGDAVLTSEVIAKVHRRFPDAHLTLVVGERAKALWEGDPRIQTLVDADAFSSAVGRLKLALALWRYHPQVVVDLRHTLYPFLLKPLRMWRYLRQPPKTVIHMRERHLWKLCAHTPEIAAEERDDAGEGGSSAGAEGMPLWCAAKETTHVDGLCRRWALDRTGVLVIICPGARSHIKRWTVEGFARVADRLIIERGAQVVFSGEPDEEPIIEEIMKLMRCRVHSAVGLTTVRQLAVLMRRARLVITNDSASLHVASAVQAPTLAIFGPTNADTYGPTSAVSRVVRRRLFCSPCEQALCRFSHECMRFISADEVFRAATELLEQAVVRNSEFGVRNDH